MINNNSFFTVQGWMVNELKLKGNELMIYAIIYGFSQDGQGEYNGSQQYLADWTNSTTRGVRKNLTSLLEKNLIKIKKTVIVDGHKCHSYSIVEQSSSIHRNKVPLPQEQSSSIHRNKVPLPQEQSSYNNIDNNIEDNIEDKKKEAKKKTSSYMDVLNTINNDELKESLLEFIKMRKILKKPLTDKALKLAINKLNKLTEDEEEQINIVNTTIEHSWLSFYPLKKEETTKETLNYNTNVKKVNAFNNFHQRNYTKEEIDEWEIRMLTSK